MYFVQVTWVKNKYIFTDNINTKCPLIYGCVYVGTDWYTKWTVILKLLLMKNSRGSTCPDKKFSSGGNTLIKAFYTTRETDENLCSWTHAHREPDSVHANMESCSARFLQTSTAA